jgi:beta-glucanase (GH16 family)
MRTVLAPVMIMCCLIACNSADQPQDVTQKKPVELVKVVFPASQTMTSEHPLLIDVEVRQTGRYHVAIYGQSENSSTVWLEDYVTNKDDRTYNITGTRSFVEGVAEVDGSPLAQGVHPMRLHASGEVRIDSIVFTLMYKHRDTPATFIQEMEGTEWELVWSDEFEGSGLPDSNKWSYNIGNWGWGNNESQYYTGPRTENARQENGTLIIEAIQGDQGHPWTSTRLTTQGKAAFTYGRIEFRAKVPVGRGTWAAGWLLGDAYRDEISWPYCGEIDVLECVGYEIDDATGAGLNHATCHTRAYYFKQGNQIGSQLELDSMHTVFHTYAIEWYPDRIEGYVDDVHYYTYDKNANELEWPFNQPQNIILNLAVGGGWGGAQGIDSTWDRHQYILDYVRVYQRK